MYSTVKMYHFKAKRDKHTQKREGYIYQYGYRLSTNTEGSTYKRHRYYTKAVESEQNRSNLESELFVIDIVVGHGL